MKHRNDLKADSTLRRRFFNDREGTSPHHFHDCNLIVSYKPERENGEWQPACLASLRGVWEQVQLPEFRKVGVLCELLGKKLHEPQASIIQANMGGPFLSLHDQEYATINALPNQIPGQNSDFLVFHHISLAPWHPCPPKSYKPCIDLDLAYK